MASPSRRRAGVITSQFDCRLFFLNFLDGRSQYIYRIAAGDRLALSKLFLLRGLELNELLFVGIWDRLRGSSRFDAGCRGSKAMNARAAFLEELEMLERPVA